MLHGATEGFSPKILSSSHFVSEGVMWKLKSHVSETMIKVLPWNKLKGRGGIVLGFFVWLLLLFCFVFPANDLLYSMFAPYFEEEKHSTRY